MEEDQSSFTHSYPEIDKNKTGTTATSKKIILCHFDFTSLNLFLLHPNRSEITWGMANTLQKRNDVHLLTTPQDQNVSHTAFFLILQVSSDTEAMWLQDLQFIQDMAWQKTNAKHTRSKVKLRRQAALILTGCGHVAILLFVLTYTTLKWNLSLRRSVLNRCQCFWHGPLTTVVLDSFWTNTDSQGTRTNGSGWKFRCGAAH